MAHFAELDSNNIVLRVITLDNSMMLDGNQESEKKGIEFIQSLFGADTIWKQTSYNGNIRKNYAGIGYIYDSNRDAFITPKPDGDYWIFDENICCWVDPRPQPEPIGVTRV